MDVYVRYFKSIGPLFCTVIVFGGIANQAFAVYSSIWLSEWSAYQNNTGPHLRGYYLGVYAGLGFAQCTVIAYTWIPYFNIFLEGIPFLAMSMAIGIGCVHAAKDLHNNLLSRTMRLPMSFFDCTPLGRIINRFSKDLDVVDNIIPQILRLWFLMIFNVSNIQIFHFLNRYHFSLPIDYCNFCGYQYIYSNIHGCHCSYLHFILSNPKFLCSNVKTTKTY